MHETISATYQYLLSKYGPLLTLNHVAEVMHTTPNGVRMAVTRQRQPFAAGLATAQRRLGRRVYFEARLVAAVVDHGASSLPLNECSSGVGPQVKPTSHVNATRVLQYAVVALPLHQNGAHEPAG